MANTKQGIYYQDNYSSVADVPSDMKKMAESMDTELETDRGRLSTAENNIQSLQSDNTTNRQDISNIKTEQTTQNANIETLTQRLNEKDNQIAELKAENEDLKADLSNSQIHGKASGEYVHLSDSAKMNCEISVLGNSRQETRQGYNKLPNNLTSKKINGVTVTVNKDKSFTLNGIANADFQLILLDTTDTPIKLQSGTYTISYKNKPSGLNLAGTENGTDVPYMTSSSTSQSITKTYSEETTITKVVSAVASGTEFPNVTVYPMIYEGTDNKEYEQYGATPSIDYPSEIESVNSANVKVCNKNLIDLTKENINIGGWGTLAGYISRENNEIVINQIVNSWATYYFILNKNFIGKKVSVSFDIKVKNFKYIAKNRIDIQQSEKYKVNLIETLYNSIIEDTYVHITTNEFLVSDEGIIAFFIHTIEQETEDKAYIHIRNFQIEEGTTATDYIAHEEQNYPVDMQESFRAIGDVRDCFVLKEDGKWYERHNIKRIIADGVNYKARYLFPNGYLSIADNTNTYVKNALKTKSINTVGNVLSNKLKTISQNSMVTKNNMGVAIAVSGEIYIKLDDATSETNTWTTDTVNAFLQENPLTIDYALAEPYYLECTEQQTQQLKALLKAKTYKNITNITTDTIAVLDVDYKRDLETIINNQNQAIIALGGV